MTSSELSNIESVFSTPIINELAGFAGVGIHSHNLSNGDIYWSDSMYSLLGLSSDFPPSIEALLNSMEKTKRSHLSPILRGAVLHEEQFFNFWTIGQEKKYLNAKIFKSKRQHHEYLNLLLKDMSMKEGHEHGHDATIDYECVLQNTPNSILLIDPSGNIRYSNLASSGMFGYSNEHLMKLNIKDLLHRSDNKFPIPLSDILIMEQPLSLEKTFLHSSGRTMDAEANLIAMDRGWIQLSIRGIPMKQHRVQSKDKDNSLSNRLAEYSNTTIIIQKQDRTILYANQKAAEFLGVEKVTDLVGMSTTEFTLSIHEDKLQKCIQQALLTQKASDKLEMEFQRRDGSILFGESTIIPFDYYGEVSLLTMVNDITDLKKTMDALKEGKKRLRFFVENAPVAVAMYDRHMNYITCSRKWIQDWWEGKEEITPKGVVGKNHYILFPKVREEWKLVHQKILSGNIEVKKEDYFIKDNGKKEWVQWAGYPWRDSKGNVGGLFLYTEFITDRKQKEAIILESEARHKALINAMPDMMLVLDQKGRCLDYHAKDISSLAVSSHDIVGSNISDFFGKNLTTRFLIVANKAIIENKAQIIEYQIDKTGKRWDFEARIVKYKKNQVMAVVRDITKSKEDERIKRRLRELFYKAFHMNPTPVLILTLEEEKILNANRKFLELVKMNSEEVIGKSTMDLNYWQNPKHRNLFIESIKSKGHIHDMDTTMESRDGEIKDIILSGVLIDVEGETCILMMIFDNTDRKRNEERLQSVTEELTRYNQELQQYTFIISHDLRAPVINLAALIDFYDTENPGSEDNKLVFKKIEQSIVSLETTLVDLIDMMENKHNGSNEKKPISCQEVLNEVLSAIEDMVNKSNVEIKADFSDADTILFPRTHLKSIFQNLITNAIKYRSEKRKSYLNIVSRKKEGFVHIYFEDNGMGIDLAKHGDKLFSMYQRFHDHVDGKGLGLHIIKSQIENQKGELRVESVPEQGTTFHVLLKDNTIQ